MNGAGAPITPRIAVLYAAGDLVSSLTSVCLAFYWLYFLIEVAGLPPLHAGLIHGGGFAISAGANLWAGHVLDRRAPDPVSRCRIIAILGPVLALLFALIWVLPPAPWREAWYVATSFAFHIVFAFVYLAYLSLSSRLGASEAERVDLSSYRFGGTMLVTLAILALHGLTAGRMDLGARLTLLGAVVAACGAVGAVACGLGLQSLMRMSARPPAKDVAAPLSWRCLAADRPLRGAVGINLLVWFITQATLVLTVFLCATARVPDALVLLTLQVAIIVAAGLTSAGVRRWPARRLLMAAALLWCLGAALWQGGLAPFAAAAMLGLGLGAGTVLSWATVAETVTQMVARRGAAEARAYAGLSLSRDLVAGVTPPLAAVVLNGRAVGSLASGQAAGLTLLAVAVVTALGVISLRRRPSADGGTAASPT